MKNYVKKFPKEPTFRRDGFDGKIENENISITYEHVYKGHDK